MSHEVPAPVVPELSPTEVQSFARRLHRAVRQEVPAYAAIADPELDRDVSAINRSNVRLFFRALRERRMPSPEELGVLEASARRRLYQAVSLDAIFHSYRVGVRVLWECLVELTPAAEHGRLASLALRYADRVSVAVARAYAEERQRALASRQDALRLLLTRILHAEGGDARALHGEASALGVDLGRPHVAIVVAGGGGDRRSLDAALDGLQREVRRADPDALTLLHGAGLSVVVPEDRLGAVEACLDAPHGARRFAVGIGTPRTGAGGVAASHREAARAHALGPVVHPGRRQHRYAELRLFDLFREGEPLQAYVSEVLGPILAMAPDRRQRMIETLRALFACAMGRKQAARRLGVHQNTLTQRLQVIERALGGDLQSGELCFRLQLAVCLLPLSGSG